MIILASIMDHAGKYIQGGLAVLGATFLGAFLAGFVVNMCGSFLFGKLLPPFMLRTTRVLGGVASGLAAGWLVFSGAGGWGLGGAGGTGDGNAIIAQSSVTNSETNAKPAAPTTLRIQMLGGARVQKEAFYLLAGEKQPRTLAELQTLLTEHKAKGTAPQKIELRIFEDSVAEDHPAVAQLKTWARDNGYSVGVEIGGGEMPPGGHP